VPQQYKVVSPANNKDEQSHTNNLTTIREFNETESMDRSPITHALKQIESQSDQDEVQLSSERTSLPDPVV
jgi:hypothetical protein